MQYTVRQAVDHLMGYLTPGERVLPPVAGKESEGRAASALYALNGALQEIYSLSKSWLSSVPSGELINAPFTSYTIGVTKGSKTATLSDDSLAWFEGCTIRIAGDSNDNEILESDVGSDEITLRNPSAASGSGIACTIYHDCLTLPSNVLELNGSVVIPGIGQLKPSTGEKDLRAKSYGLSTVNDRDYGFSPSGVESAVYSGGQPTGNPKYYWLDTVYLSTGSPRYRLKMMPMPTVELLLEYRSKVTPPDYDMDDVHDGPGDDPGIYIPAPHGFTESIILPVAAQRFKASPHFRNDSASAEISRQYEVAIAKVRGTKPQPSSGITILPAR